MNELYDLDDLKTQIRHLRALKSKQKEEQEFLENEAKQLQVRLESLKQQLNIESVNGKRKMNSFLLKSFL